METDAFPFPVALCLLPLPSLKTCLSSRLFHATSLRFHFLVRWSGQLTLPLLLPSKQGPRFSQPITRSDLDCKWTLHLRLFFLLFDPVIMFANWTETMTIFVTCGYFVLSSRLSWLPWYLLGRTWCVSRRQSAPRLVEHSHTLRGAEISRSRGLSTLPAVKERDCRLAQREQRQKTADND